ncbi:homoserine kinase [Trueperella sp. LYQ143]|uniref:homoserine kinase n=1 Tax=unclassified Trueperella TaxID=2630174 RepID=UPI003983B254
MRFVRDNAQVRVPASSGNLGPGFDSMGMAHDVWDEVSVTLTTGTSRAVILGEGSQSLPRDESHLIIRVIQETCALLGLPQAGIDLVCRNAIPHGKGLGSSAAAVVAGLMLVRELVGKPKEFSRDEVLRLATQYEGHPDNAAPAIFGGTTLSWQHGQTYRTVNIPVDPQLRTTVVVPQEVLPTAHARSVLPDQVPHSDAAFNAGRAGLLVHALTNAPHLLFDATEDRLHQDYRAGAMEHSARVLRALRSAGWPVVVSGAGPALLVFASVDSQMEKALAAQGMSVIRSTQVRGAHAVHG